MLDSYYDRGTTSLPALAAPVRWIDLLLTGTIGTSIAILAIAAIGFLLFSGRVPLRRGIGVIVGCFILFSSATIAQALTAAAQQFEPPNEPPMPIMAPHPLPPAAPPAPYDPYASASVPDRSELQHDLFQK